MANLVNFFLSQSILIPIIVGLIRIRHFNRHYQPFFLLLLIGFFAELASFIFIDHFNKSNAGVIKIYSLLESLILLYQFYVWRDGRRRQPIFGFLWTTCLIFWVTEVIIFNNFNTFSPYFRVFYAFVLVLLSINQINSMIFNHEGTLFKNPRFILCLGFIVIFLYQIIYEASFFIGSEQSAVANKIIMGFGYINFIINLLYAVAMFFITDRKNDYNRYFSGQ
jgi:hypothetical protein